MTPEDIDNMQAGRELDMLVAEKVMGVKYPPVFWDGDPDSHYFNRLAYSTDIAAAWQVVEKMKAFSLGRRVDGTWQCWWWQGVHMGAHADTAPLAICRAALKAISAQQPQGAGK